MKRRKGTKGRHGGTRRGPAPAPRRAARGERAPGVPERTAAEERGPSNGTAASEGTVKRAELTAASGPEEIRETGAPSEAAKPRRTRKRPEKAKKRPAKRRERKRGKRDRLTYFFLAMVFILGFCLMAYPTVSDYWNSFHQTRAIMSYAETISGLSDEEYDALYQYAVDYNSHILERNNVYLPSEEEMAWYHNALNLGGNGVMGYITIPVIDQTIPIYHGTSESVLQTAEGHLDWTSLPVGGEGTHCVLSGHRGLPSARLFTDLDKLVVGDTFILNILDETLTYEVDQILIVLPQDIGALKIVPGMDYCTLVTCTPYGINTHRMLVRGHRIENAKEAHTVRVTADATQIESMYVAPVVAAPLLVALITWLFLDDKNRVKEETQYGEKFDWESVIRNLTQDWGFEDEPDGHRRE